MKRQVSTGYTFTPSTSHIDLTGVTGFTFGGLLGILNLTTSGIVYLAGTAGYGASAAGPVLTLQASMAGMASSDTLAVIYDDGTTPAQDATVAAITSAVNTLLKAGQSIAISGSLPAFAATPTVNLGTLNGAATDATGQSILAAIQSQRQESLWTDDTGAFFVRVDKAGVITWTDISGTTASAPGTGARPADGIAAILDKSSYQATASGTGYSTGDLIDHVITTDPSTGAVIGHFWLNLTTEAKLVSAPSSANITPLSPLPPGAATSALQTALITAIAATQPRSIASNAPQTQTTGTLTNINDAVTLAVDGMNTAVVQAASGTWTGSAIFEASVDGGMTFVAVNMIPYAGGAAAAGPTPGTLYEMACGGLSHVRVRASTAITSGPASIILVAANGLKSLRVGAPAGNPLPTYTPVGTAVDLGNNQIAIASTTGYGNVLLRTLAADPTRVGRFLIQNQSNSNLFIYFDDGTSSATDNTDTTRSMIIIGSAGSSSQQGGSISDADIGLFKGRIRVYGGNSTSQIAFRAS